MASRVHIRPNVSICTDGHRLVHKYVLRINDVLRNDRAVEDILAITTEEYAALLFRWVSLLRCPAVLYRSAVHDKRPAA